MATMRSSVSAIRDSSRSTWLLSVGHLAAVLGDVREVGLAARADLVDVLDFGLHRVDQLLAAGDRCDALVELGRRAA